jgi:hypothetical protein
VFLPHALTRDTAGDVSRGYSAQVCIGFVSLHIQSLMNFLCSSLYTVRMFKSERMIRERSTEENINV